jgi:hypothetical protein
MFTNDPTNPIDRIRLTVGDTDELNEYISDQWYSHFLTKNTNNETRAAIDAAKAILVRFTSNTREKVDQVEVYGNELFPNYLQWLKEFIESPALSGLRSPSPYAGGVSISDMTANNNNIDNNTLPIKSGFIEDSEDTFISEYWRIL